MEAFQHEENGESSDETGRQIIAKHGKGETRVDNGVPRPLHQILHFGLAQRAEEHLPEHLGKEKDEDKGLDDAGVNL